MDVMTAAQAAEKWGVSLRWVQILLKDGRIAGAVRLGRDWLIPADAEKPGDPRRAAKPSQMRLQKPRRAKASSRPASSASSCPTAPAPDFSPRAPTTAGAQTFAADFAVVLGATYIPMPRDDPDTLLDIVAGTGKRLQAVPEVGLAYWRGDFEGAMRRYRAIGGDDAVKLCASPSAIAAAICAGDYPFYLEIEAFLKYLATAHRNTGVSAFAELALATAYTGASAPNMVADWLKNGDLSALPDVVKPDALYLRAKVFQGLRQHDSMLAVTQTALCFCPKAQGLTYMEVNLNLICAVALSELGRAQEAEPYLLAAMRECLPNGYLTGLAVNMPLAGGLVEKLLEREYPAQAAAVLELASRAARGWFVFHNRFTKENITHILSARDYQMARRIARREPYAKVAKEFNISVGTLNNTMRRIYAELAVSNRDELSKVIF